MTVSLMYHRILPRKAIPAGLTPLHANIVPLEEFSEQVLWLRTNYRLIGSIPKLESNNKIEVEITIDDGFTDSLLFVAPLLEKLGIRASYFLVSGFLSKRSRPWWERLWKRIDLWFAGDSGGGEFLNSLVPKRLRREGQAPTWRMIRNHLLSLSKIELACALEMLQVDEIEGDSFEEFMDWSQAKELVKMDHASIGFHSDSHASLPSLTSKELNADLEVGLHDFHIHGISPSTRVAYPYGKSSVVVARIAKRFGFTEGYRSSWVPVVGYPRDLGRSRVYVGPNTNSRDLGFKIMRNHLAQRSLGLMTPLR